MKTNMYFWSYLAQFFLEWKMYQPKLAEKNQNTHFTLSFFFIFENRDAYMIMWEKKLYQRTGRQWQYGYTHTYTHSEYVLHIAFPR